MVKNLFTKPVWWWERKRSYPVRLRFRSLPPIAVEESPSRFVVLTTLNAFPDAMWTAWSWYRYLQPKGFELQLAVDGKLPTPEISTAERLFPGISIYNVNCLVRPLCDRWPNFGAFFHGHPYAKQVGLVLALNGEGSVLYSDHDVLAFQPPVELLSHVDNNTPCYFEDEGTQCHDPVTVDRSIDLGLGYIPNLNCGFLYVPKDAFSAEDTEQLLKGWSPTQRCYFTSQTVQSALMRQANGQPLPRERYVISNRRQFYFQSDVDYRAIAARHFTGTVRHVMYRAGIPEILRQARSTAT